MFMFMTLFHNIWVLSCKDSNAGVGMTHMVGQEAPEG